MSTIQRHAPQHHWWYAAAAAAAAIGLLALLVTNVFWVSSGSEGTAPPPAAHMSTVPEYHGREVCFAHRSTQSIELARAGCTTP